MFTFKKSLGILIWDSNKIEFNILKFMALSVFQETVALLNHLSDL